MIENLKSLFLNPKARAAGLIFGINSFMFGSWVTHLPEIKSYLQLTDGEVGLALLGVPLGSIISMPFMGWIIHKFGSGKTTLYYALLFCLVSVLPLVAFSYFTFFLALVFVGLSSGSLDIAMNAAAASVEKHTSLRIMSGCHGLWSTGGMLGAGITSVLVGLKVNPLLHILVLAVILFVIVLLLSKELLSIQDEKSEEVIIFSLPGGALIGLAVIGFCIMMGEGAVYDWSAIYLRDTLLASAFYSGLGYAGFSLTMAVGRFYGDKLIHDWGPKKLVITGAAISFAGILLALLVKVPILVVAGFTLAGLGYSCLVPSVYISAARMKTGSAGSNLAAVASVGYFGLLAGPPLIGVIAEHAGLTVAMGVVLLLMLLVIIISGKIRFE